MDDGPWADFKPVASGPWADFKPQTKPTPTPPADEGGPWDTFKGLAKSVGTGLERGVAMIPGAPGDILGMSDLARKGIDYGLKKAGIDPGPPGLNIPKSVRPPTTQDIMSHLPQHEPQNAPERYAESIASMVPLAAAGPGGLAGKAAAAVGSGVGAQAGADVGGEKFGTPLALVGALAGGGAGALLGAKLGKGRAAKPEIPAEAASAKPWEDFKPAVAAAPTPKSAGAELAPKFVLEPTTAQKIGARTSEGRDVFNIKSGDKVVGNVLIRKEGNTATIDSISLVGSGGMEAGRGKLGISALSELKKQYLKDNPEITRFAGDRVTGARVGTPLEGAKTTVRATRASTAPIPGATPSPVGAEAPAAKPLLPARPTKKLVSEIEDDLFRTMRSKEQERDIGMVQASKALPKELQGPEGGQTLEKFYKHSEGDPTAQLSPGEKMLYDQYIAPVRAQRQQLYEDIVTQGKKAGLKDEELADLQALDPTHTPRMTIGKTRDLDQAVTEATPQTTSGGGRFSTPSSLKERKFFSLESPDGKERKLVTIENGKVRDVLKDYETISEGDPKKLKVGQTANVGDKLYNIKHARSGEIEGATKTEFYKNAWLAETKSIRDMERYRDQLQMVQRIKDHPEASFYMTHNPHVEKPGWKETRMPGFSGYKMDPKLANALDDMAPRPHSDAHTYMEALANANRIMVGTLFWNPIPHIANVGAHALVANGWQNFNPLHYPRSLQNMGKAMKEVATQGPLYRAILKEGGTEIFSRVQNAEMWTDMMKRFGAEIVKDPEKTGLLHLAKIAKVPLPALVKSIYAHTGGKVEQAIGKGYTATNKALWYVGDVFMTHRVIELQEKGLSLRQAIHDAERDIPNYRVPSEVLGSRLASQALRNNMLNVFGRYHYGVARGIGAVVKDLAVGDVATKVDALGKAVTLAALTGAVYPLIMDPLARLIADNDKIEASRRGPAGPVQTAIEMVRGGGIVDRNALMRAAGFEASPVDQFALALLANKDWMGKNVVEPAASNKAQLGQVLGYAGGVAVAPLSQAQRYLKTPHAIRSFIADAIVGMRKTPPKEGWAAALSKPEAISRARNPNNIIERYLADKAPPRKRALKKYTQ